MFKKIAIAILATSPAFAGGGIGYSATDGDGTVERIVERRALPGGLSGALVSYTRSDGSRSFVEYAFACEPLSYAYLGMDHDDGQRTPNLKPIRDASDELLSNEARPVQPIQLSATSPEAPIRAMALAVCS
jgi:hypothetical protein